jgi:hypothetical protein
MRSALPLLVALACSRHTGTPADAGAGVAVRDVAIPDVALDTARDDAQPKDSGNDVSEPAVDAPAPDAADDASPSCNGLDACACEIASCQRVTYGCSCASDFCAECGTGCDVICLCGGGPYLGCAPPGCADVLGCPDGCQFVRSDGCLDCTPGCP